MNDVFEFTDVLNKTTELWNAFDRIEKDKLHPDDTADFKFHIHALQNILLSNIGWRYLNTLKNERKA